MYQTVLIPTDGSDAAERAVARGIDLARTYDAALHTLYVVDTRSEPTGLGSDGRAGFRKRLEERGQRSTTSIQERAADAGLGTRREIRAGVPHQEILDYIQEHDVDLVVMGTHGQLGPERTRLGSTTERVIRLADVPVLAVRAGAGGGRPESAEGTYRHVVVPTDGSDVAERAAAHGFQLAERYGADVHIVYVVDTTTYGLEDAPRSIVGLLKEGGQTALESLEDQARDRGLQVVTDLLRGVPEEQILDYTTGVSGDLIVMGTRGRTAGAGRLLGSTTARVVRRSAIPVLTVS